MDALTEIILISFTIIFAVCLVPVIGVFAVWYFCVRGSIKEKKYYDPEPKQDDFWDQNLGI